MSTIISLWFPLIRSRFDQHEIFQEILYLKLLTQNRLTNGQNLALFHELKKRSGTWLSPPRLVKPERAFFFFQISEIKFLG